MSGIDLLSLPPGAPSPLVGTEEVPVYVNDTVQTTTTQNIANVPLPVYEITSGVSFAAPVGGGTIVVRKPVGSATYITLQPVATGVYYCIKDGKGDAATNNIVINTTVGTIDGLSSYIVNWPFGAIDLQFDGTNWNALSNMSSGGGGGVDSFNNRTGNITLTTADVTGVGGATTAYVTNALGSYLPLAGGNVTGNLGVGGNATVSGNLTVTGTAFASTPAPGDNTNKLATTAFVEAAVVASTTGVATFNGRTGSVVLTPGDITGAGGATQAALSNYLPLAGGAIAGPVTAPTPVSTDNSTNIATTAFVASAVAGGHFLPLTGGTLTGPLTVSVSGGNNLYINGAAGTQRGIFGQTNGSNRWLINLGDTTAETGSNAGSNFDIVAIPDSGSGAVSVPLSINRATGNATFSGTVNAAGFQGNSYNSSGNNSGYFTAPRNGGSPSYGMYSSDGSRVSFWQSNTGDIVTFSSSQCFFNEGITVANAPQIHMTPSVGAGGYGAMWHNDGSNTYLLLTNQNDAQGGWNGLRPFTVNDGNGAVSMNQGLTVSNNLTANNINTQYGIVYSGYAGNVVSFRWTGVLQIFIDGNYNGDIATSGSLGNYLPISGGTVTGQLTVNGLSTFNGVLNYGENKCYGYVCRAGWNGGWSPGGNHFNFNWASPYMAGYVDNTALGNISFASDYRIKRNIANLGSMWDRVKALRPISYNIKDFTPPGHQQLDNKPLFQADNVERWGFLAHELQDTLIQDAATGVKDDPAAIQAPNPWVVIASLTRALQEAMARIEVLEAKVG